MPHISALKDSNYLQKADVEPPVLVTIKGDLVQENVAKDGAPQQLKWCIHFRELDKPMVLNSTNGQLIAMATCSENSEDWDGKQVVLYNDPNVSFQGKLTGGIRVRAPKKNAGGQTLPPAASVEDDDSVPF